MLGEILALASSMQNSAISFDGLHPGFALGRSIRNSLGAENLQQAYKLCNFYLYF